MESIFTACDILRNIMRNTALIFHAGQLYCLITSRNFFSRVLGQVCGFTRFIGLKSFRIPKKTGLKFVPFGVQGSRPDGLKFGAFDYD